MLVQKLRVDDLQSEKGHFDGVMVYAQNKVPIQVMKYIELKCNFEALLVLLLHYIQRQILYLLIYFLLHYIYLIALKFRLLIQNVNQVIKGENQVTYWVEISSMY